MTKAVTPPEPEHEINLREALEERYLAYALSTIMRRTSWWWTELSNSGR